MIVADRKSVPEIRDMVKRHNRVLLVGCGTCVTVCLAGGEREVGILGSAIRMALKLDGRGEVDVDECTIERQCEDAFIDILAPRVGQYDATTVDTADPTSAGHRVRRRRLEYSEQVRRGMGREIWQTSRPAPPTRAGPRSCVPPTM